MNADFGSEPGRVPNFLQANGAERDYIEKTNQSNQKVRKQIAF